MHKLSLSYLQKSAYGSMPLEPTETRPRSNFHESKVAFPRYNQVVGEGPVTPVLCGFN